MAINRIEIEPAENGYTITVSKEEESKDGHTKFDRENFVSTGVEETLKIVKSAIELGAKKQKGSPSLAKFLDVDKSVDED